MNHLLSVIETTLLGAFGLFVAAGLYGGLMYRNSERWRLLATAYGRDWEPAPAVRHMREAVLYGGLPAFQTYKGILSVGVFPDGIAMKIMLPFGVFHPPIFVPFSDITGWQQDWYLNAASVELTFEKCPDIKILMPTSQIEWVREVAGAPFNIAPTPSPHNAFPRLAHGLTTAAALIILVGTVLLIVLQPGGVTPEWLQ